MHEKKIFGGITHQNDSLLQCCEISFHSFEDPLVVFLKSVSGLNFSNLVSIEFRWLFIKKFFLFPMNKDMQEIQQVKKMLAWIHCIFNLKWLNVSWPRSIDRMYINKLLSRVLVSLWTAWISLLFSRFPFQFVIVYSSLDG